jgi:hypothetical protein
LFAPFGPGQLFDKMSHQDNDKPFWGGTMGKKRKQLPGTVNKIIKAVVSSEPEKAQIDVEGADDLYREIRIENSLTDDNGQEVRLREGAQVNVSIEADTDATLKKPKG